MLLCLRLHLHQNLALVTMSVCTSVRLTTTAEGAVEMVPVSLQKRESKSSAKSQARQSV